MSIMSKYLGTIPALYNLTLIYTPALKNDQNYINAQKFHRDTGDKNIIHMVIPVMNIKEHNGPFTYINAKKSKVIIDALKHEDGRVDDDVIERFISPNEYTQLIGDVGSVWFLNPYHCFHFGARVKKGFRLLLIVSFSTPHEVIEGFNNLYRAKYRNKLIDNNSTQAEKHLLKHY